MPTYDLQCTTCNTIYTVWCKPSERQDKKCPECGGTPKAIVPKVPRIWNCDKGGQP